ncbi:MAG TPA: NAD-dependent epimerase/dehydratase family protein [Chryseolinea sp.]|nr:NAD-dependent epimerase/dehydratase family protein [Chryseolinea sp.]
MKNILITGGAGFIGASLANLLIDNKYEVTILDNLSPQIHGEKPEVTSSTFRSINGNVKLIVGSVTNGEDMKRAIAGQDAIVHFAAETGTGQSMYRIQQYVDINVGGTGLLLDILANSKHNVQKVVVASSRSIYGEGRYYSGELNEYVYPKHRVAEDMDKGDFEVKYPKASQLQLVATDEESKIHPSSVYGITKQNQEQMVMTVCPTIGIQPVAFRYQNVYGPGQSLSNPYTGILSIFSSLIRTGKSLNIFEDGKESRDFVFIDDVVSATFAGLVNDAANGEVFNVGTGTPTTINTVADTLIKGYGREVPVTISGSYRLGDIRHNFASMTKIQSKLGFVPQYDFQRGIQKFIEWVEHQEIQAVRYNESIEEMKAKGLLKVGK